MWILWTVLGVLSLLMAVVLLLPIHLIIKNDENNNMLIRYRLLGKTFGQVPKPENPFVQQLKKSIGISQVQEKMSTKKLLEDTFTTVKELCGILGDFLRELTSVLKHCTAKKFRVRVVCAADNAADTAIAYGRTAAVVYGLAAVADNLMKVRKRGRELDIRCDFDGGSKEFRYEFVIMVRAYTLLFVLLRLMLQEVRRQKEADK